MAKSSSTSSSKRFIIALLGTVLLCAGTFFAATEWLLQTQVIPHDHMIKRAKLFHARPHINTIFGDSQMRDGINGLDGFSNFSTGSQTYPEIETKIKAFYKDTDEPFKIIIHAAINNFAEYRDRPDRKEINAFFINNETNGPFMTKPFFQETAWRYWRNYIQNDFTIQDSKTRFNEDGSTTRFGDFSAHPEAQKNKIILEMIDSYTPLENPQSLKAYTALNNIFEYLKTKNAHICMVMMPMQKEAAQRFTKVESTANVLKLFEDTAKTHNIRYVNFIDTSFPDNYFDDASHVNERGAHAVTRQIQEKCF